ncbi:hypothetical protein CMV_026699 [Castanea mollissima]|uniref:DUF4283 domain-containing protein n=1 Tax=Castanea mollissima TaxID=60419 RepID=A0A8J4V7A8_9ROSI|nr:hypothetical protein CMV_026699 [Castanea mollissima]
MDAAMEELWKKFLLSEEEKGILAVSSQEVALSKEYDQFKVGNNLFLAIFVREEDMMEVPDRSPWSFDRKLILLKRFNGDLSPGNVSFQYSPFWIRVFNIPIKSINKAVGNCFAKEIGVPLLVDAPKSGLAWGPFLRIRVDIDITKPLMRGKMIHIEDLDEGWDRECQRINKGCFHTDEDEFEFGPWLRSITPKTNHKKGSSSKRRSDDDEEEDNLVFEGEEDTDGLFKHRQWSRNSPMAGNSNGKNFRQKLDESRNLEELRISKISDHIRISNLERDQGVSETTTSTNLLPSIIQVLKSQEYRPGSSVVDLNSSGHQLSNKLDPISKECSFNTTLPATKNLVGKSRGNQGTESRVKKRWEIPSEVMVYKGEEDGNAASISEVGGVLPKIRSLRCVNETPRASGPAKRVAELIGRRSYFCNNEEVEPSVCQALSFAEGDAEEE